MTHETHICCQGLRKICSDDQKMKYDKINFEMILYSKYYEWIPIIQMSILG